MDLTSVSSMNFHNDDSDLEIETEIKPIKKISLSTPKNDRPDSFDDSFEIKK